MLNNSKYLEVDSNNQNDDDDDGNYDDNDVHSSIQHPTNTTANQYHYSRSLSIIKRILTTNLTDDEGLLHLYRYYLCGVVALGESGGDNREEDGVNVDDGGLAMVKLVKLWIFSVIGIMIVHPLARWMEWEIDEDYTLQNFIQYDFSIVLMDLLFFFIVGRLYNTSTRGIDILFPWGIFGTLGAIYPSIANDFAFLRHSISMYDIMCSWPIILFVYSLMLLALGIGFGVAIVRSHHRRHVLRSRIIEAMTLLCLFVLPYLKSDSFHLHHWFGMWFLGMQSNAPEWWSRTFQAFALGSYVNGIAVYGRDPILGCQLAFYRSTNLDCEFMQCYMEDLGGGENETGVGGNGTGYKDFVAPDWRICNAESLNTYP